MCIRDRAFARYRVGDMYRCVGLTNKEDQTRIPRFHYVDRIPTIIDIAAVSYTHLDVYKRQGQEYGSQLQMDGLF